MPSEAIVNTTMLCVFNVVFIVSLDTYVQTPMQTEKAWSGSYRVADDGADCSFSRVQTMELWVLTAEVWLIP